MAPCVTRAPVLTTWYCSAAVGCTASWPAPLWSYHLDANPLPAPQNASMAALSSAPLAYPMSCSVPSLSRRTRSAGPA